MCDCVCLCVTVCMERKREGANICHQGVPCSFMQSALVLLFLHVENVIMYIYTYIACIICMYNIYIYMLFTCYLHVLPKHN